LGESAEAYATMQRVLGDPFAADILDCAFNFYAAQAILGTKRVAPIDLPRKLPPAASLTGVLGPGIIIG